MIGIDPFDAVAAAVAESGHDAAMASDAGPVPILPVPADAPPCKWRHYQHGQAVAMWDYHDAEGALLGHDARFESASGEKTVLTLTWCQLPNGGCGWRSKAFPKVRPIYGLDRLASRPLATVIIAEGCKAADAAALLLPNHVAVAWPGGCKADHLADWEPLAGRNVTIWPDHDVEGIEAATRIAKRLRGLQANVSVIDLEGLKEVKGWDAADALAAGWSSERAAQFVSERAKLFVSADASEGDGWGVPDMTLLNARRRSPPPFPAELFGPLWPLVADLAAGAGAPVDYIAGALLGTAAALVGTKRQVQPFETSNWKEPAILWIGAVGEPSSNKTPALSAVTGPLRAIEDWLGESHAEELQMWQALDARAKAEHDNWKDAVKKAAKNGADTPSKPLAANDPDPLQRPRLMVMDTTPEALWDVLEGNPQGVLSMRDELAGWLLNFDRYNGDARAFFLEAWNGKPFTVDRKSRLKPMLLKTSAVSVLGGIQPDRLATVLLAGDDDGMAARIVYFWPEPVPYRRPQRIADVERLDRLFRRLVSLKWSQHPDGSPAPVVLPLEPDAADRFETWKRENDAAEIEAGALYKGFVGKASALVLRGSLVVELLIWADEGNADEPRAVSLATLELVCAFVETYAKPMALRVFGDAALKPADRAAASLARYIKSNRLNLLNLRIMRRVGLPLLKEPMELKDAANVLVEAEWLKPNCNRAGNMPGRLSKDYLVNPAVLLPG